MDRENRGVVIFDWDGVIVDSAPEYMGIYGWICEKYGKIFPIRTLEEFREWYDSAWENNFTKLGFAASDIPELLAFEEMNVDYERIGFFEGIREVLLGLAEGYDLGIASTSSEETIHRKLTQENLDGLFAIISGGEDGKSEKKEKISKVVYHFGRPPEQHLMIGDTVMDVVSAKSLGIKCIGVSYGWNTRRRLEEASPCLVLDSPAEIIPAIRTVLP
ncbi:MAG: HAD family hydrolase [Armatimonadetes bacterium]|nr:HAD family hydrolase [Armatimonadota bacterium]